MKKYLSYSFDDSDVAAMVFSLNVFPTLNIAENDAEAAMLLTQCTSAIQKLLNHETRFSASELNIISVALDAAQLINQGILNVDSKVRSECSSYLFEINKLAPMFSDFLS